MLKTLLKAAVAVPLVVATPVHADTVSPSNSIVVGPVTITNDVNGVPVSVTSTVRFALQTEAGALTLKAQVESDLSDLQVKFGSIIDKVPFPRDNCKSFTLANPVVGLGAKELKASADKATAYISGEVDAWTCLANPVPETYWDPTGCKGKIPIVNKEYVFGCPKTRPGSPIKNKTATQLQGRSSDCLA